MSKRARTKRLVVISDLHCGHRVGLTPPIWQISNNDIYEHFLTFEKEMWKFYKNTITSLQPIEILVVNGDCIDGKGERSGSTELLEADRNIQCDIAADCINLCKAKEVVMTFGTPYHVGVTEDFERNIADKVNAKKIGGHEWLDINGVIFDFKHHIGSSTVPHGRATSLLRDQLWNDLWSLDEGQPRADVLIRSHIHYHMYAGDPNHLVMSTPALMGYGSKYGVRQCSGKVDIGLIHFDINTKGGYIWGSHILNKNFLKVQAMPM
jgi:hypothetical protein